MTYHATSPGLDTRDPFAGIAVPAFLRGRAKAACANPEHDANWWFPNSEVSDWRQARRICLNCPLLYGCREYAIEHEEAGVWDGLTQHTRTRTRHRREATP